uniref:Uncharacterized protein n=1 Tax=Lactuca sativa TaxID=4236 RepID=A0A9R1VTL9_LACSA|nr:hypothetical protein LSAT_V11C400198740 [Lactuca sativa]
MNPTDFMSIWFQNEKFVAAYTTNISHVNGRNMWAPTDYIKPFPPLTMRMHGSSNQTTVEVGTHVEDIQATAHDQAFEVGIQAGDVQEIAQDQAYEAST